jgi:hypothetical protein
VLQEGGKNASIHATSEVIWECRLTGRERPEAWTERDPHHRQGDEQMAVLWLKQFAARLSPTVPNLDSAFRRSIQTTLDGFAQWQSDKYKVAWVNNLTQQAIRPEDCLVYFVGNYSTGVGRRWAHSTGSTLTPAQQGSMNTFTFAELGMTYNAPGQPTLSEVHIDKCLHALRLLRANNPTFSATEIVDYPIVLAAYAWHEAMHNKVEPHMGRGWDLHVNGGGGWANGLTFGTNGGIRGPGCGPMAPTQRNMQLMQQHFAKRGPQFIV